MDAFLHNNLGNNVTDQVWMFTNLRILSTLKNILVGKYIKFIVPNVLASTLCESPKDTVKRSPGTSASTARVRELQNALLWTWTRSFPHTWPRRATLWAVSLFHIHWLSTVWPIQVHCFQSCRLIIFTVIFLPVLL